MDYPKKIEVSMCCKAELVESFKDNPRDHHDSIEIYTCAKCKKECDVDEVCVDCLGTGEVSAMEAVYPGEPHMADIGVRVCICQRKEEEYNDQD